MAGEDERRRKEGEEAPSDREDFSEYVEYLKEKYSESSVENAEKVEPRQDEPGDSPEVNIESASDAERERNELDEFRSYVKYLRQKYEFEGESKDEDPTHEANVKTEREAHDKEESSAPGNVQRELAESQQPAELANASMIGGNTKTEEAPDTRQDQAPGGLEVGGYQQEDNDDRLEQQTARSETKQEGVSGPPERANGSPEAANPARVGESPKSGEVRGEGEARVSKAGAGERAKEMEPIEGRVEIPQPHEGATLKTNEANSRQERDVAAVGPEPGQAFLKKNEAPTTGEKERILESNSSKSAPETRDLKQSSVERSKGEEKDARMNDAIIEESGEVIAIIQCKSWSRPRVGFDGVQLVLSRRDIEEQSGTKLREGKTYCLEGTLEDTYRFQLERTVSKDRYLHICVPKRYCDEVKLGETYSVKFYSIRETGKADTFRRIDEVLGAPNQASARVRAATEVESPSLHEGQLAVATSKAYKGAGDELDVYFSLRKPKLEQEAGINFKEGKTYLIRGKLDDVCEFEIRHHESGYGNQLTVTAPKGYAENFRLGSKYKVYVDKIQEVVGEFPTKKSESEKWDWKLVAAWVDTEGSFSTKPNTLRATITQKERGPLEGIRSFLEKEGIRSKIISTYKWDREYFNLITKGGMEDLATFVVNIEPYIRTNNKKEQIARLRMEISRKTKLDSVHRKNARRILGLE
jgi:hypothetical protein